MSSVINLDVLIVGAGLAGLMAAHTLAGRTTSLLLVDKGRSVGGRMATRRIGVGRADHGAQFFTARDPKFQALVADWLTRDWVYQWSTGWPNHAQEQPPSDGHPRYAARGGMNQLAKALAADLPVQVNTKLTYVSSHNDGWLAEDEAGQKYQAKAVLLTPPVEQSVALLTKGDVMISIEDKISLGRIMYEPCVCGLFLVEGGINLPDVGAVQNHEARISWIADNQRKGISPEATVITVHANPSYSRELYDLPQDEALAQLQDGLTPYLTPNSIIKEANYKRWRYALPRVMHPKRHLRLQSQAPLVCAGDAFGGPRVEGAVLSGLSAGEALKDVI